MKGLRAALLLAASVPAALAAAETGRGARFAPFLMDAARIQVSRHRLDVRLDLDLDAYRATSGTTPVKGLFTRARPSLEYRYAAGPRTELFVRAPYTSQTDVLTTDQGGERLASRHSAGFSSPTFGAKLALSPSAAAALDTTLPTAAPRDPPLGDGAHYGGRLLFHAGSTHLSFGHVVRLPYRARLPSGAFRRDAGDLTTASVAFTRRDAPSPARNDHVGALFELHGTYADQERLDGAGIAASATFTGKAVLGFVVGKLNPGAAHLTRVAVAVGFGDVLHRTEDPLFGVGDVQLAVSHSFLWD